MVAVKAAEKKAIRQRGQYKLSDLVQGLNVTVKGDPDCLIDGVCTIHQSEPGSITFLSNPQYKKYLKATQAAAVVLDAQYAELCTTNAVISSNPYYTFAMIAGFFAEDDDGVSSFIHPTVQQGEGCKIHPSAVIGAHCVLGNHVNIAEHVTLAPGCVIGDFSEIGAETRLDANVTIYHKVKIGKRTRIASGVVIGSDGFGFANHDKRWHKVPQLGGVTIGDDVDIGSNTSIDRGAIEDTVIESGVKLDNLIQVGHNVRIGENTIIAGCVGIAGSAHIGKNCMIGGASSIIGHIQICDNVLITGASGVDKSIHEPGIYSSGVIGIVKNNEFRKNNARFHRLEHLVERVKQLESILKKQSGVNEN